MDARWVLALASGACAYGECGASGGRLANSAAVTASGVRELIGAAQTQLSHDSDSRINGYSAVGESADRADQARREAELLLMQVLGVNRAWLYAHGEASLDATQQARFSDLVNRRMAGEPIAYITAQRAFWTLDLKVSPQVLIPRAETELLVALALEKIPSDRDFSVADLGTGSGAIALALATERRRARIVATDLSAAALEVARDNAALLKISNVTFARGDWCDALGGELFDLIVSNPPYIRAQDPHLISGDLRFEPRTALASGHDGLAAILTIANCAARYLAAGAWLMLEHGQDQGPAVRDILQQNGFMEISTMHDIEARERVSAGRRASPAPLPGKSQRL